MATPSQHVIKSANTPPGTAPSQSAAVTTSATGFNISEVPFFRAMMLFETEKYQEAFPLFLTLTQKCNLPAAFYLNHLLENSQKLGLKITEDQQIAVKKALEYFHSIPKQFHPDAWLKASLLIVKLNKAVSINDLAQIRLILPELSDLGELNHASNALVALLKYYPTTTHFKDTVIAQIVVQNSGEIRSLTVTQFVLLKKADLLAVSFAAESGLISNSANQSQEWNFINKFPRLANNYTGTLEEMMARSYNGVVKDVVETAQTTTLTQKKSAFTQDLNRKLQWQITGAHMGSSELQGMFGYVSASFMLKSERDSWCLWAALNNDPGALILIGQNYYFGNKAQFPKDYSKARAFFQKSFAQRKNVNFRVLKEALAENLRFFGFMEEYGHGRSNPSEVDALQYYQESAELKDPAGCFCMGVFYENGQGGLVRNFKTAVQYYQQTILNSEAYIKSKTELIGLNPTKLIADAHYCIARLYNKSGFGLEKDFSKAVYHAKQAAENSDSAKDLYGAMIYLGEGITQDKTGALKWMIPAARAKYTDSAYFVAHELLATDKKPEAFGLTEDDLEQFLLIALKDRPDVHSRLGTFYVRRNQYAKAEQYIKTGLELGQAQSFYLYGGLYEMGCEELKIQKDDRKAFEYYHKAAERGHAFAMSNEGFFLLMGRGTTKDVALAKDLYEKSLTLGCLDAAYNLACMYSQGRGVTKDDTRSFQYLKMAESTRDPDVLYSIALSHAKGEGTQFNYKLAMDYYKQAADLGHGFACYYYALNLLKKGLNECNNVNVETFREIEKYLKVPYEKGYATAIFFQCMLILFIDYKQKEKVMTVLEDIQKRYKPYRKYRLALELLSKPEDNHSKTRLLILLCERDIYSLEDIYKHMGEEQSQKTSENVATMKKMETSHGIAKASASSAASAISPLDRGTVTLEAIQSSTMKSITETLNHFLSQNLKKITFTGLKKIIRKVTSMPGVSGSIKPSTGGSNQDVHVDFSYSKGLRFPYHPRHTSGQKMDAALDRRRNLSVKKFAQNFQTTLISNLSHHAFSSASTMTTSNVGPVSTTTSAASLASTSTSIDSAPRTFTPLNSAANATVTVPTTVLTGNTSSASNFSNKKKSSKPRRK